LNARTRLFEEWESGQLIDRYQAKSDSLSILNYRYRQEIEILIKENPDLSMEWTDAELNEQVSQWQSITDISSTISRLADSASWDDLLVLADTRQALIDQFFETPICVVLFQQILIDLAEIQTQHKQVLSRVEQGLERNQAKEHALKESRAIIANNAQVPQHTISH
tara:strand:- start:131 stop:628 length:498 start_codon:yes stop_codon:yes gene_type:complete